MYNRFMNDVDGIPTPCFMSGTQHINRVHIIFWYSYIFDYIIL